MDRKRLLLVGLGVLIIFFVAGGIYLMQRQSAVPTAQPATTMVSPASGTQGALPQSGTNAIKGGTGSTVAAPTGNGATVTPLVSLSADVSPADVAKSFYTWYIGYSGNVLTSGAYKNSPYITDDFKLLMTGFAAGYNPKYDPVFCTINKTSNISVNEAAYSLNNTKATVQIMKNGTTQNLYNVVLKQVGNVWKVDDVMCIPPGY